MGSVVLSIKIGLLVPVFLFFNFNLYIWGYKRSSGRNKTLNSPLLGEAPLRRT